MIIPETWVYSQYLLEFLPLIGDFLLLGTMVLLSGILILLVICALFMALTVTKSLWRKVNSVNQHRVEFKFNDKTAENTPQNTLTSDNWGRKDWRTPLTSTPVNHFLSQKQMETPLSPSNPFSTSYQEAITTNKQEPSRNDATILTPQVLKAGGEGMRSIPPVNFHSRREPVRMCYNCGENSHFASDCPHPWKPDGRAAYRSQRDH